MCLRVALLERWRTFHQCLPTHKFANGQPSAGTKVGTVVYDSVYGSNDGLETVAIANTFSVFWAWKQN
jgi:hypothetical protein